MLSFVKKLPFCLPEWLRQFAFPPAVNFAPHPCQHLILLLLLFWILATVKGMLHNFIILICYSLTCNVECMLMWHVDFGEVSVQSFCSF